MPQTTLTIDTSDAQVYGQSGVYATARTTSTTIGAAGTTAPVGQRNDGAYRCDRYAGRANLTSITGTRTGGTLRIYVSSESVSSQHSTVVVVSLAGVSWPLVQETVFDAILAAGASPIATLYTSASQSAGAYYEVAIPAELLTGDYFQFGLIWTRDINANAPGAFSNEYVTIHCADNASNKPQLVVDYTLPATDTDDDDVVALLLGAS